MNQQLKANFKISKQVLDAPASRPSAIQCAILPKNSRAMRGFQAKNLLAPQFLGTVIRRYLQRTLWWHRTLRRVFSRHTPQPVQVCWHYATSHYLEYPILAILFLTILIPALQPAIRAAQANRYKLSTASSLLTKTPARLQKNISYDAKNAAYTFTPQADEKTQPNSQSAGGAQYSATLSLKAKDGVSLTDTASKLGISLTPQFETLDAKQIDSHIVYPLSDHDGKLVYTFKGNGLKEDIVLYSASSSEAAFDYTLKLPSALKAQLQDDGSIGIYGGDRSLYGNISYGSDKDKALVQKAQAKSAKTTLIYVIPAPVVKSNGNKATAVKARFSLDGEQLTIHATHLIGAQYPLTIDPSLALANSGDFNQGNDDGNIDFSVAGQVSRSPLTGGSVGSWTNTGTAMLGPRQGGQAVAYNGFMYMIGGRTGGPIDAVQYAVINADGTLGTWLHTTVLPNARYLFSAVINAGYLYIIGGQLDDNYTPTAAVLYAQFNGDGTIGAWTATTSFSVARTEQTAWVNNNVLYVAGGCTNNCAGGNIGGQGGVALTPVQTTSVEYAPLNTGTGAVSGGVWTATTAMPSALRYQSAAVDNARVYLAGGDNNAASNLIYVGFLSGGGGVSSWTLASVTLPATNIAPITYITNGRFYVLDGYLGTALTTANTYWTTYNSGNGLLGASWTQTTSTQHDNVLPGSVLYGGKIYMLGGVGNNRQAVTGGNEIWSQVEYSTVNADGSLSSWQYTNPLTIGRLNAQMVALNGYVYSVGGAVDNLGQTNDVLYASIDSSGNIGTWQQTTNSYVPFLYSSLAAHNGALYGWNNQYGDTRVMMATPSADGSIDHWTTVSFMPQVRTYPTGVIVGNYLYFVGGYYTTTNVLNQVTYTAVSDVYYAPILPNKGIGAWTLTTSLPSARYAGNMFTYNNRLYYAGGLVIGGSTQSQIFMATQNADGTVSSWQTLSTTYGTFHAQLFAWRGYLYSLGGNADQALTTNYYAPIYADGTLGVFQATTALPVARVYNFGFGYGNNIYVAGDDYEGQVIKAAVDPAGKLSTPTAVALPAARGMAAAVAYNGYLYVAGGCVTGACSSTNVTSSIIYAAITATGLGSWTTASAALPAIAGNSAGRQGFSMFAIGGKLIIIGGTAYAITTAATVTADVATIPIASSGDVTGSWTTSGSLVTARDKFGAAYANGFLYVYGGIVAVGNTNKTEYASVNESGAVGSWTQTSNYPATLGGVTGVGTPSGYIYGFAGNTGSDNTGVQSVYYAKPAADGSIPSSGAGSWTSTSSVPNITSNASAVFDRGYIYISGGQQNNNGSIVSVQVNSDGSIPNSWLNNATLTGIRQNPASVAAGGNIYVCGGYASSSPVGDCNYAQINNGGPATTSAWANQSSTLPVAIGNYEGVFVANGYIYAMGGTTNGGGANRNAYYTTVSADGTIGTSWTATTILPTGISNNAPFVYNNGYVYMVGGNVPCGTGVYFNTVSPSGGLGASWTRADSQTIPGANPCNYAAQVYHNRIYVIGGWSGSTACSTTVRYATIQSDGTLGSWTTSASQFSVPRSTLNTTLNQGYLYLAGGFSGSGCNVGSNTFTSSVEFAQLDTDGTGTVGAFIKATSLPVRHGRGNIIAINGYMYSLAGQDEGGNETTFGRRAPILTGGYLGEWESMPPNYVNARVEPALVSTDNLRVTMLGGATLGATYKTSIESATVLSLPRKAQYSRLFSTDKDTTAANVISHFVSGNGTLAVSYSNATLASPVYGSATSYNQVPSIKLTLSGYSSRAYHLFTFTLDDTDTASFPDSSATSTTLTYFQFNYHPNSSMRLRGGGTFNASKVQSLDAP